MTATKFRHGPRRTFEAALRRQRGRWPCLWRRPAAALCVLALVASLPAACKHGEEGGEEEGKNPNLVVAVKTAVVKKQAIRDMVETAGTLTPPLGHDAQVSAQVAGKVARVIAEVGKHVQVDEPVMELDTAVLKGAARQAEADLRQAQSNEALAQKSLDRQKALAAKGIGAGKDLTQARADLEQAAQARAHAEAAMELAQTQAGRAVVKSPVAGTILKRDVGPGQYVQPDTVLFTVAPTETLELSCMVPSTVIATLHEGQEAEVSGPGQEKPYPGRVTMVAPAVDAATGTAPVRIAVDNGKGMLRPGMLCRARIVADKHEGALTVPVSALAARKGKSAATIALVDEASVAHVREVTIGIREDDVIEIKEGVEEGQKVVSEGSYGLPDGTKVRE